VYSLDLSVFVFTIKFKGNKYIFFWLITLFLSLFIIIKIYYNNIFYYTWNFVLALEHQMKNG
jgi:hypothetical protein